MRTIRRLLVTVLCMGSLLTQTTALAFSAHALPVDAPKQEQPMPCHGDAPAPSAPMDCCGDDCACYALCAGTGAVVPTASPAVAALIASRFEPADAICAGPSSRGHPRFRPPIPIS